MFTTLNVVQENVLKGKLEYDYIKDDNDIPVIAGRKMKAVKSIDKSTKINQYVWDLAKLIAA